MVRHSALLLLASVQVTSAQVVPSSTSIGMTIQPHVPTDLPTSAFPGPTAAASNAAWATGQQPAHMSAWPQLGYGSQNRSIEPCWKKTVLHDTVNGWPGLCVGLKQLEGFDSEASCEQWCSRDPRCPVWQFNNQTYPGTCWVGLGTKCAMRGGTSTITVQRSQRLMHGDVLILKNLSGWKINNLKNLGQFDSGNEVLGIERCKAFCYSFIGCEYWQYASGTGPEAGCYVQATFWTTEGGKYPDRKVQYPLTTTGGATPNPLYANGEYIQHYCPPYQTQPTQAPVVNLTPAPPAEGGSWLSSWGMWAFGALVMVGGILGCLYYFMLQGQDGSSSDGGKRRKGKRAEYAEDYAESPAFDYQDEGKPLMQSKGKGGAYDMVTGAPMDDGLPPPPSPLPQPPATMNSMQQRGYPGQDSMTPPQTYQGHHQVQAPQRQQHMPPPTQLVDFGGQAMGGYPGQQPQSYQANYAPQLMQQGMPFPRPTTQQYGGPGPRM